MQDDIQDVFRQWRQRLIPLYEDSDVGTARSTSIFDISPFRLVLHKANKMKMLYGTQREDNEFRGASQCHYFALMWIPSNTEDGMNGKELKKFIGALRRSGYFTNKLNKESVYISGPSYGSEEKNETDGVQNFDLNVLRDRTKSMLQLNLKGDLKVDIEIVIHELAKEVMSYFIIHKEFNESN